MNQRRRLGIGKESRFFLMAEVLLTNKGQPNIAAHLARSQDPADLPHDRFVTAEIRRSVKDEADVVSQVVPVVVSTQLHGEPNNSMVPSRACNQPTTKGARWYH
jgi:hypothetical protein